MSLEPTLRWALGEYDDNDNPCWEAASRYHAGGDSFQWLVRPVLVGGEIAWSINGSTPELIPTSDAEPFLTKQAAMDRCEELEVEVSDSPEEAGRMPVDEPDAEGWREALQRHFDRQEGRMKNEIQGFSNVVNKLLDGLDSADLGRLGIIEGTVGAYRNEIHDAKKKILDAIWKIDGRLSRQIVMAFEMINARIDRLYGGGREEGGDGEGK